MDLKEFARATAVQRALDAGRPIDGDGKVSAKDIVQIVPESETRNGVEVHQTFSLKPPTLTAPNQIVVTRIWTSPENYKIVHNAAELMYTAKIAPGLVIQGIQNEIHTDTKVEQPITITPNQVGTEEAKALMIPDFDPNPIETFGTGPDGNYIYFTQKVFSKPGINEITLQGDLKQLEDPSKLPATLSGEDDPEGYQGTQVVIIQAAPEAMMLKAAPAQQTSIGTNEVSFVSNGTDSEEKVDLIPGTNFVPKVAQFSYASDFNSGDKDQVF